MPSVSSNRSSVCNITEAEDVRVNMERNVCGRTDGTFANERSAKALGVEGCNTDLIEMKK